MAGKDSKFLELAKKRFQQAQDADQKQREREQQDLRFYAGDQWPEDIQLIRKGQTLNNNLPPIPARPTLTINLTREPVRQILNQERQADMGIELIPADDFGGLTEPIDHTEIELREGLIRRIQRDSEAADARTWAFSRAVIAGRGYYGVMTRYVPGKSFDQEVFLQRYYNQASVSLDPAHEQPDGSDAEWGFVGSDVPWLRYKAEYPNTRHKPNKVSSCDSDEEWRALGEEAPGWFSNEGETRLVRVVEYWFTERVTKELVVLKDGRTFWRDELPPDTPEDQIEDTRTVVEKQIKWAKIDGCQVLDETDWPGHFLPIIKVLGEELQPYDQERRSEGMVRPALDSCRSFNYMVSKWVETIGLAPIPPWIMAAGQDEGFEEEWFYATTRALPALHYNQKDVEKQPAPPPQRVSITTDIAAIAGSVQLFKESITDTMGVPPPALGHVDPTLKSGKAIKAVLEQAQRGTSNYLDNLIRSMRHEARVINDLLYPIYGARPGRLARMMSPEGEHQSVILGQPFVMQGTGKQAKPIPVPAAQEGSQAPAQPGQREYRLTKDADWNVAIKVSKNYDTRREQEAATLGEIIAADPAQMQIVGDLFFKYQDGPGHEEMSERYKLMLAPPIQEKLAGKSPLPPEVQAQMQQMQMALQELQKLADDNLAKIEQTKIQEDASLQKAKLEIESKERMARESNEVKLTDIESRINAAVAQAMIDWQTQHAITAHEHENAKELAQMQHAQALQAGEQQQAHALQQGEQQQDHAVEQGQIQHANELETQAAAPPNGAGA